MLECQCTCNKTWKEWGTVWCAHLRKPICSCGSSISEHAQAGTETEMASHTSDNSQTRPAPGPNKTPLNLTPPYLCQPFMGPNFVTGLLQENLAACPTTYWSYQINTEDSVQPNAIAVCSQDERESPSQSSPASKAEKSFNIHPPLYVQKDHTNCYVLLCPKTHLWSGHCWEHKPAENSSIRIQLKFWYL